MTNQQIEEIKHKYTQSLIGIGINPEGKDLLEVIAYLADKLNRTMWDLHNLEVEFYNFKYKVEQEELNK